MKIYADFGNRSALVAIVTCSVPDLIVMLFEQDMRIKFPGDKRMDINMKIGYIPTALECVPDLVAAYAVRGWHIKEGEEFSYDVHYVPTGEVAGDVIKWLDDIGLDSFTPVKDGEDLVKMPVNEVKN